MADTTNGCGAPERDLSSLEKWAEENLMKFQREHKALNLRRNNSVHRYSKGPTGWKAEGPQGPKVLTDKELNIACTALLWVGWSEAL